MDRRFSEMFIEKMRKNSEYNFIIMNTEGIIIAATEKERVGVFHQASYTMMLEGREMISVYPDEVASYFGAKPGVDMPIRNGNTLVGAIGITGSPDVVRAVIMVAKMTMETMLEYDDYKERATQKRSNEEAFFSLLIKDSPNKQKKLSALAQSLQYEERVVRIPILFALQRNATVLFSLFKACPHIGKNDWMFSYEENEIIIFKEIVPGKDGVFHDYKEQVRAFVTNLRSFLIGDAFYHAYYIGSLQDRLAHYGHGYKHCMWMKEMENPYVFFYDCMDEYVKYHVPMSEYKGIFGFLSHHMTDQNKNELLSLAMGLKQSNYNLAEASKNMFIHKNTLIFRLNKIRNYFNINPVSNGADRAFLDNLGYYLYNLHRYQKKEADAPEPSPTEKP